MSTIKIKKSVETWLAKYFDTNNSFICEMLDSQIATTFLLIWPIMENKIFDGFFKINKIQSKVDDYYIYYKRLSIETKVVHFYKRYQDNQKLKNLCHRDTISKNELMNILNKEYELLSDKEKLSLLFYVLYRFRNNIFHGNKGILSWENYTLQIHHCIDFMINLIDLYAEINNENEVLNEDII